MINWITDWKPPDKAVVIATGVDRFNNERSVWLGIWREKENRLYEQQEEYYYKNGDDVIAWVPAEPYQGPEYVNTQKGVNHG